MKPSISMRALVLLVAAFCGTHFCSAVQILNDGQIITGTEKEPLSFQLLATNGVLPYAWNLSGHTGYRTERNGSSFSETGTSTGWLDNDGSWVYDLPFEFAFYGERYTEVYVNDNGTLSFGEPLSDCYYDYTVFTNTVMIAPLWADMIANPGDLYVHTSSNSVTFRWNRVYFEDNSIAVNVSATLYQNGDIVFSYGSGNDTGFVGISAGDGENYTIIGEDVSGGNIDDIAFRFGRNVCSGVILSPEGFLTGVPLQAGTNTFDVTVTDANGVTTNASVKMIVFPNANKRPVIETFSPTNTICAIKLNESDGMSFSVAAKDPEGVPLSFSWYVDDIANATSTNVTKKEDLSISTFFMIQLLRIVEIIPCHVS